MRAASGDTSSTRRKWPQWYPKLKGRAHRWRRRAQRGHRVSLVDVWASARGAKGQRIRALYTRIGWYGYAPGTAPSFYHTWVSQAAGRPPALSSPMEVGKGNDAAHLRETDESLMHRGHDLWLATLKMDVGRKVNRPLAARPRLRRPFGGFSMRALCRFHPYPARGTRSIYRAGARPSWRGTLWSGSQILEHARCWKGSEEKSPLPTAGQTLSTNRKPPPQRDSEFCDV